MPIRWYATNNNFLKGAKMSVKVADFPEIAEAFKKELRDLLTKYNVIIGVSFEGDHYGIWGEKFYVEDPRTGQQITFNKGDMYISASDLV